MFLPHFIAVTILVKLSSSKIMPAAYLATSVPAIPIANPISAFFKAGASFVPSPVIATTSSNCFNPVAIMYLSYGEDLAKTLNCLWIFLNFSILPTDSDPLGFLINPSTYYLKAFPYITLYS
jgi:hypothetical protein